ncbi:MAG: ParB/RepB/Spo0J family partition protein [Kofleriaceae bacterium]|nr:ParB/RepB/Spo0J family partition protein [Kofleriaceae bacterium]
MVKRIGKSLAKGIQSSAYGRSKQSDESGNELSKLLASFGLDNEPEEHHDELIHLPTSLLCPGSTQPRTRFYDESLEGLAESIRSAKGIIEPLVVHAMPNGMYEIIAGERRWRAADIVDLETVPCVVKKNIDEQTKLIISLVENIQRENLSPMDEAEGLNKLVKVFELSHQKVADIVGRSRSAVSNLLRLLELSPICKTALNDSVIEMGHARALLPLSDIEQAKVLKECIRKRLTVRAVERRVSYLLNKQGREEEGEGGIVLDDELLTIERTFAQVFLSPVYIKALKSGEVIVKFKNIEIVKKLLKSSN